MEKKCEEFGLFSPSDITLLAKLLKNPFCMSFVILVFTSGEFISPEGDKMTKRIKQCQIAEYCVLSFC